MMWISNCWVISAEKCQFTTKLKIKLFSVPIITFFDFIFFPNQSLKLKYNTISMMSVNVLQVWNRRCLWFRIMQAPILTSMKLNSLELHFWAKQKQNVLFFFLCMCVCVVWYYSSINCKKKAFYHTDLRFVSLSLSPIKPKKST